MAELLSWVALEKDLSSVALTVRAQALPPNDRDRLVHDIFFPRRDVDSTTLSSIIGADFRPVSDRREWNARGRYIPQRTFKSSELEMIPIEDRFGINEAEMQKLVERTLGNEQLIRQLIGVDIPTRTDGLVDANRRRMEIDAMRAWALGQITVMNPETGATETVEYGFDVSRYQTAGTAWSNGAVNAYTEFLAFVEAGVDAMGAAPSGAVMRLTTFEVIRADAPQGINAIPLTRAQFRQQLQNDLGFPFTIQILENSFDEFGDAGHAGFARTKVWPDHVVALIPNGVTVGAMAFAPVVRAYQLSQLDPEAQIDVRGMTVVHEIENAGRGLNIECQVNAFPVPEETNLWVIDAGA